MATREAGKARATEAARGRSTGSRRRRPRVDRQPGGAHQARQLPAGVAVGERVRDLPRDVPLERDVRAVDRQRGPVGVEREHGAAGPGHADQLGQHGGGIGDVLQHPLAAAGVEPAVGEGETRAIRDQVRTRGLELQPARARGPPRSSADRDRRRSRARAARPAARGRPCPDPVRSRRRAAAGLGVESSIAIARRLIASANSAIDPSDAAST